VGGDFEPCGVITSAGQPLHETAPGGWPLVLGRLPGCLLLLPRIHWGAPSQGPPFGRGCSAYTGRGLPCSVTAVAGTDLCWFHSRSSIVPPCGQWGQGPQQGEWGSGRGSAPFCLFLTHVPCFPLLGRKTSRLQHPHGAGQAGSSQALGGGWRWGERGRQGVHCRGVYTG